MKFNTIIFDMDGTIIDTEHIWRKATNDLVACRGVVITKTVVHELEKHLKGISLDKGSVILKEMFNFEDDPTTLALEQRKLANALYEEGIRFIAGFETFHKKALKYNLKVGIATNADDYTLEIAKRHLSLSRFFGQHIYNISHVNNVCKPDPDLYLYACKQLKTDPDKAIAIEDSFHGVTAALSAGLFCIGINPDGAHPHFTQNAHFVINHYDEIDLSRLLKLNQLKNP